LPAYLTLPVGIGCAPALLATSFYQHPVSICAIAMQNKDPYTTMVSIYFLFVSQNMLVCLTQFLAIWQYVDVYRMDAGRPVRRVHFVPKVGRKSVASRLETMADVA
jgi:hypothetical protein